MRPIRALAPMALVLLAGVGIRPALAGDSMAQTQDRATRQVFRIAPTPLGEVGGRIGNADLQFSSAYTNMYLGNGTLSGAALNLSTRSSLDKSTILTLQGDFALLPEAELSKSSYTTYDVTLIPPFFIPYYTFRTQVSTTRGSLNVGSLGAGVEEVVIDASDFGLAVNGGAALARTTGVYSIETSGFVPDAGRASFNFSQLAVALDGGLKQTLPLGSLAINLTEFLEYRVASTTVHGTRMGYGVNGADPLGPVQTDATDHPDSPVTWGLALEFFSRPLGVFFAGGIQLETANGIDHGNFSVRAGWRPPVNPHAEEEDQARSAAQSRWQLDLAHKALARGDAATAQYWALEATGGDESEEAEALDILQQAGAATSRHAAPAGEPVPAPSPSPAAAPLATPAIPTSTQTK